MACRGVGLELMLARYLNTLPGHRAGQRDAMLPGVFSALHCIAMVGTLLNHVPCHDRPGRCHHQRGPTTKSDDIHGSRLVAGHMTVTAMFLAHCCNGLLEGCQPNHPSPGAVCLNPEPSRPHAGAFHAFASTHQPAIPRSISLSEGRSVHAPVLSRRVKRRRTHNAIKLILQPTCAGGNAHSSARRPQRSARPRRMSNKEKKKAKKKSPSTPGR
ncbi:unnamed protein product [Periconia digitata]|uniref:Uncharacterized protein n=1 Tax=Periconia digitata TaxID=1303443 RepID=A0A9W4XZ40_9PLEO|nr:unnamed protein product [Periconia digitata]